MAEDYRRLCIELFGTDDVETLREIAQKTKPNARNAGRKPKFTDEDVLRMEKLRNGGMSINEIADRFGTSRQVIGRYLNAKPEKGYTLRMTYLYRRTPCTVIDVDFLNERVMIQNKTDDLLHRAFGVNEHPTWEDVQQFLRDRCLPETRGNLKDALKEMGLDAFDPWQIAEKTHGRMADDDMWLRFQYYPRSA